MYISRRRFIEAAGLSGAYLASRLQGLSLWAASEPSACRLHSGPAYPPPLDAFWEQIQPGRDSFITERYAAELESILDAWGRSLCSDPRDLQPIARMVAPTVEATALEKATVTVLRGKPPVESEKAAYPPAQLMDHGAFLETLHGYLESFRKIDTVEFQITGIEVTGAGPLQVATEIHYDLVGALAQNRREERTGAWDLVWQKDSTGQWLILKWSARGELRTRLTGPGFVDITASCFAGNPSYEQQLRRGVDYWRTVLDGASGIDIYGNNGVAVGDFDGDGFDDVYVCQPAGLPNRLYRNRGDGTFEDVTEKAGVGVLDGASSALFADLNNNGHQDLIVVRTSGPLLYVNRGDGVFSLKPDAFQFSTKPSGTFTGISVADYNRDGLLDIYFCLYNFYQGLSEYQYPSPYYDARNGPPNFLLENRGNYIFEDVTVATGLHRNNDRFSFAGSWCDYNHDGWPDLYVVNDFGRKVLYRNNGDGTFTDVSVQAGVEDPGEGMSATWLDYDNDGFEDLYVVNMWEPAGKRIMTQDQFLARAPEDVRHAYLQDAMGNSLLHNEAGRGTFRDVTDDAGARLGGWNWGSDSWDLDHDGYPDLYVANGFISGPIKDNLSSFFWRQVVAHSFAGKGKGQEYEDAWNAVNEFIRADHSWSGFQRNNCYINDGNGSFAEAGGVLGVDILDDSRSFALADLNHDGRLNVVLKNRTGPQVRILENRLNPLGLSIAFSLRGATSNRDAIGAVIELETPAGRQRKTVSAGSGFLMQHTKDVYFGLGPVRSPVRALISWPNGARQSFENLPPGHRIEIVEGSSLIKAAPFAKTSESAALPAVHQEEILPDTYETWMVEPISAPDFTLADGKGEMRQLQGFRGRPLLLTFCQSDCAQSQKQLQAMQDHWPESQRHGLQLLAMRVDGSAKDTGGEAGTYGSGFSFPMLTADEKTRAVYNIFHRYLFERRRDMPVPATLLIDPAGAVIKVYSGHFDGSRMLEDWLSAPVSEEARLRRALPFSGHYLGNGMHHDYFSFGVAFLRYGYLAQSLSYFRQAIDRNPSYAAAHYNIGLIYLRQNKLKEARAHLEEAVALDPGNANVWNNLGVACGESGDYDRALAAFQQALALEPAHLLALQNLARLYKVQGRAEDARKPLESAIAADPNQAGLHLALGMLLVESNDLQGSKSEFERATELEPRNSEAWNGLGVVLMRMGQRTEAISSFEQCRRLAPESDRAYLNLALIYVKSGDLQKAKTILNEYLENQHDSRDVRKALKDIEGAQ